MCSTMAMLREYIKILYHPTLSQIQVSCSGRAWHTYLRYPGLKPRSVLLLIRIKTRYLYIKVTIAYIIRTIDAAQWYGELVTVSCLEYQGSNVNFPVLFFAPLCLVRLVQARPSWTVESTAHAGTCALRPSPVAATACILVKCCFPWTLS
jgi:hypothetical protein